MIEKVEWKTLGEVLGYEQPGKYIVDSVVYNDSYKTPVLTAGQTFILGYTDEEEWIFRASKENPVIIFDDFTTSFHWVDFDFKVKSSAMKMLRCNWSNNYYELRFLYFVMKCIHYIPSDHSRHWISKYSQFKIPIPSLATQQRIVTLLDKFDALVNDLTTGLPAELESRKKQYEHYRNQLLTFTPLKE